MRKQVSKKWIKELCKERKLQGWQTKIVLENSSNLNQEQIELIAIPDPALGYVKNVVTLIRNGFTIEQIKEIISIGKESHVESSCLDSVRRGMDVDTLKRVVKKYHNDSAINSVCDSILMDKIPFETIESQIPNTIDGSIMQVVLKAIKNGFTNEQIQPMLQGDSWNYWKALCYVDCVKNKMSQEDINLYMNDADYAASWTDVQYGIQEGFSKEQIDFYMKNNFSSMQRHLIQSCMMNGLTLDEIHVFAKPRIEYSKMALLSTRVKKFTTSQMNFLVDRAPDCSIDRLKEMVAWFDDGLSEKDLNKHSMDWYSAVQMMKARYKLSNKEKDYAYKYAMSRYREQFFATPFGITLKSAGVLIIFLFFLITGICVMQEVEFLNTTEWITAAFYWFSEAMKYMFVAFLLIEFLKAIFIMLTPHPDTSLRHIINVLLSCGLIFITIACAPNRVLAIAFQFLIMVINLNIYKYLCDIKYYS